MARQVPIDFTDEAERYLTACARIRGISQTRLIQRLFNVICSEQMVLAVLDDDSKRIRKLPDELTKSHYRVSSHEDY